MAANEQSENVYILITQCMQNGFFLANENRLCLNRDIVNRMLVGTQTDGIDSEGKPTYLDKSNIGLPDRQNRRQIDEKYLRNGPLYQFFDSLTGPSKRDHQPINIIHVRDWHAPSMQYDEERRLYGVHCEANTWEAEFIDGFHKFLKPWDGQESAARSLSGYRCNRVGNNLVADEKGDLVFYDVRSDSVFDFKYPDSQELKAQITPPSAEQRGNSQLGLILDRLIGFTPHAKRVYVVVAGVYTDIKVKTLLVGLRSRYHIDGLFVSDILTDAPTLERHLEGLDFASKVVNAIILHSLNDVVSVLNPGASITIDDDLTATTANFSDYANYFNDRQKLLAFQDQRLIQYLDLTSRRSGEVYDQVYKANRQLIRFGSVFLWLTIVFIVANVVLPLLRLPPVPTELIFMTTGLTIAQMLTSFFLIPMAQMRNNVNSLVRLRNYLETYSTVTGLLRYHLTKAERLQPNLANPKFAKRAKDELALLTQQIDLIQNAADRMSKTFYDLTPDAKVSDSDIVEEDSPPDSPNGA